jgi:glycosyltransferase involved in cell wall biosynthesis
MKHIDARETAPTAAPPVAGRKRASLIIPVFNSKMSLRELDRSIAAQAASPAFDFEIVYVDDNSTDGSLEVLRDIEAHTANVVVVELPRNHGQSKAVLAGILVAKNDIVVTLDDDLQHRPRDIARLLAALDGASRGTLVIGVADALKRPLWRAWCGLAANAISNLFLAKPLPLQLTTFCAFHRQLCAALDPASDEDLPLLTALVQAAEATRTVPISLDSSRRAGSRYGLAKLFRLFMSRSRYYRLPRVLAWLAVASLLVAAGSAPLLMQDVTRYPAPAALLVAIPAASWLMLALLAIRVGRQPRLPGVVPANRPA